MVMKWDQKAALATVKETFAGKDDILKQSYERLIPAMEQKREEIKAAGPNYIPTCEFQDVVDNNGRIPEDVVKRVRDTGCLIIKNVIDDEEVLQYKKEIQEYWYGNEDRTGKKVRSIQNSKAQVKMRQHPNLIKAMVAANYLWHDPSGEADWVPSKLMMYNDGCRIRFPGNPGGMDAHVDSGGIDRWLLDDYREIYNKVWEGKWEEHDPFIATKRVELDKASNQLFRAFQGWVSLSEAGQEKGTIRLCPTIREQTAYYLLKPLVDPEITDKRWPYLQSMGLREELYPLINECLVTIPDVQPGDYVLWHCDLAHSVEYTHNGEKDSSVAYIPAAPMCSLNAKYLVAQRKTFLEGSSCPDYQFRHEDPTFEPLFENRGSEEDMSEAGKQLMGFAPYTADDNDDQRTKDVVAKCNAILGF